MSFVPIKGTDGTVKYGPSAGATTVGMVRSWSFKSERSKEDLPPHIGDPDEVTLVTGKKGSLDMEFTIPNGRNAGQTSIQGDYESGGNGRIELVQTGGYTITFATPAYTSLEITNDAKGTPIMKVTIEGAYTLAASA